MDSDIISVYKDLNEGKKSQILFYIKSLKMENAF